MRRAVKRTLVMTVLALLVLVGASGGGTISPKSSVIGPYRHDLLSWEVRHLPDKWWHRLFTLLPGRTASAGERTEAIGEYFELGDEARRFQGELELTLALPEAERERAPEAVQREINDTQRRRKKLQPEVEEALEALVTAVLEEMRIITSLGPLRWPPVDFTFEPNPLVLVTSPRGEVRRLQDVTLRPGVGLLEREELEGSVEELDDVSALVVRIGGIATYPASVSPTASLHEALVLASHEWLHHHLFFRPLGRSYWTSGALTSINETVANIAGREIGDRIFTQLTGRVVERPPYEPPSLEPRRDPEPGVFDFRREMRRTRLRLDELLRAGRVEEAEAYLEEQRHIFVENGHPIRKLNQAYFAFHGTYADSPASVSPIEPQLQAIRAASADLAEFLDQVSGITSGTALEELARAAEWEPAVSAS